MKTTLIKAISRVSVKIKDNFYTFEYGEERSVDDEDDIEQAREELWTTCNDEVDKQVEEVVSLVKGRR